MPVEMGQILKACEQPFLEKYGGGLASQQRKVYRALMRCQSGELGTVLYACPKCQRRHVANCSCGNRHCPLCQGEKTRRWVEEQEARFLPCEYAMITFTVPSQLHGLLYSNPREGYSAMFEAARDTLRDLLRNPHWLGAEHLGMLAILHTWGSQLQYHPHIHILLPVGGLSPDRQRWISKGAGYTFPVEKVASPVWRAKLLAALKAKLGPSAFHGIGSRLMDLNFVVHAKPVGNGQAAVRYLSKYVNRVAISNRRILKFANGEVHFTTRDKDSGRWKKTCLPALEFVRRFMQHILPQGFVKVRHYGFLHRRFGMDHETLRGMVHQLYDVLRRSLPEPAALQPRKPLICKCGEVMQLVSIYRGMYIKAVPRLDSS